MLIYLVLVFVFVVTNIIVTRLAEKLLNCMWWESKPKALVCWSNVLPNVMLYVIQLTPQWGFSVADYKVLRLRLT